MGSLSREVWIVVVKHVPGGHNQLTHGMRGGKGAAGSPVASPRLKDSGGGGRWLEGGSSTKKPPKESTTFGDWNTESGKKIAQTAGKDAGAVLRIYANAFAMSGHGKAAVALSSLTAKKPYAGKSSFVTEQAKRAKILGDGDYGALRTQLRYALAASGGSSLWDDFANQTKTND